MEVENGCILKVTILLEGPIFHWTMIMGGIRYPLGTMSHQQITNLKILVHLFLFGFDMLLPMGGGIVFVPYHLPSARYFETLSTDPPVWCLASCDPPRTMSSWHAWPPWAMRNDGRCKSWRCDADLEPGDDEEIFLPLKGGAIFRKPLEILKNHRVVFRFVWFFVFFCLSDWW